VEVIGVALASHFRLFDAVPLLQAAADRLALFVFAAGILGTLTANLLNIYTGATSLLALGILMPRALAAVLVGVLGTVLALLGMRGFSADYESFLLLLSYWIAPWLGVVLSERAMTKAPGTVGVGFWAFVIGLAASVPFMSQSLCTGPAARAMGGADIAYYVGGAVAASLYLLLRRGSRALREPAAPQQA
jgi:NCS1 family nucleobase:cation symporter-1